MRGGTLQAVVETLRDLGYGALRTRRGVVHADVAVIATAAPVMLRGLYWAKTSHNRSYLTSYRVPETTAEALPSGSGRRPR